MFQFTTTTLVNSLKDYSTGLPLIEKKGEVVYVKHQGLYKMDETHKICAYKTEGHDAWLDTIDLSKLPTITAGEKDSTGEDQIYRLALYIRSIGNADPLFSNDFVFKGKPFYVEFTVPTGKTAKVELAKNLNKYMNITLDKPVLKPAKEVDSTERVSAIKTPAAKDMSDVAYLVAANEYMRITKLAVEKFVPAANGVAERWVLVADMTETEGAIIGGAEGFGTFAHLEKDFRLPTAANLRWKRPMADEMPAAGAIYDEYILHYIVDRGQVAGLGGVGEQITSETTHVFWVQHGLAEDFESALTKIGVKFVDMTSYGIQGPKKTESTNTGGGN